MSKRHEKMSTIGEKMSTVYEKMLCTLCTWMYITWISLCLQGFGSNPLAWILRLEILMQSVYCHFCADAMKIPRFGCRWGNFWCSELCHPSAWFVVRNPSLVWWFHIRMKSGRSHHWKYSMNFCKEWFVAASPVWGRFLRSHSLLQIGMTKSNGSIVDACNLRKKLKVPGL